MDIHEMRERYRALLAEMEGLSETVEAEARDFNDDEQARYDTMDAELKTLQRRIERQQRLNEARERAPLAPPSNPASAPRIEVSESDHRDFRNLAEFVQAATFRRNDPRLRGLYRDNERRESPAYDGLEMQTPSSGGYLVPDQFLPTLLQFAERAAVVRPRATVLPPGERPDATVHLPMLDQSGDLGVYSGVQVAWIEEGGFKPETRPSFDQVTLEPYEIAAHVPVTDKALRNAPELELIVSRLLTAGIAAAEDLAFIQGLGSGSQQPTGFIGHASALTVNRANPSDVTYADLTQMASRMLFGTAPVWLASQRLMPVLMSLTDGMGRLIWQQSAREGVPSTLFGYPVIFTNRMPAVGARGDLVFVDLSYYLIKDGTPLMIAASEHVQFLNNRTVIKAFKLVDGKPWPKSPLKDENGASVSPFVVLDVPSAPGGDDDDTGGDDDDTGGDDDDA